MGDNKIVHRISLEGAEKVSKQLESIGDAGEKSAAKIQQAMNRVSGGKFGDTFGGIGGKTEEGRAGVERLRDAIHTLHPILDSAGLGLSNLGAFARVAGAGIGALAASIVGSVIVALAKMGDEAIIAKKRLGDILQNPAAGKTLFEDLRKQAKDLGTDVSNLLPSMENLLALRAKARPNERYAPGVGPSDAGALGMEKLLAAEKAVFEGLKTGGATTEQATQAMNEFFAELAKTGQLSSSMIESLSKTSPGFANTLAQSLQRGLGNSQQLLGELAKGAKISAEEIITDLNRVGPAIHQALVNTPADAKTFSDALDHAKTSAKDLLDVFKGPNISIPLLEELSKTLQQDAKDLNLLIGLWQKFKSLIGADESKEKPANAFGGLGSKFAPVVDFLKKAATDPGALVEKDRNAQSSSLDNAQWPAGPVGKPAGTADVNPLAPTSAGPIVPMFNDDGTVNPYGGLPNNRPNPNDGYSNPFAQAPGSEAERLQQQRESAAIGKREGELQKLFNQNIAAQNGGNHPSLDKSTYAPPIHGHYDPRTQHFVANPKQPRRDPSQVPGAPFPTTFPTYQERLTEEFRRSGKDTIPGDPAGISIRPVDDDSGGGGGDDGYAIGGRIDATGGGHIQGPGTTTSDSIPLWGSNEEYMIKADAVKKIGVANLDMINAGHALGGIIKNHFADGGNVSANATHLSAGEHEITATEDGGAIIDGVLYPFGSAILNDPAIKQKIAESLAGSKASGSKRTHKSDFVGVFGGHVFDEPGSYAQGGLVGSRSSFGSRLAAMGFANGGLIDAPHLAIGGMPDIAMPDLSGLQDANSNGGLGLLHPVTVNLPAGGSVNGMYAQPDAVKQLERAAVEAAMSQAGPRPSWHK